MKKIKLNRKGFTLIELLAVIVILAILITVSVPAVTKYLAKARKGTYTTNALSAIDAVKNDYLINGATGSTKYTLENINALLDKKLVNSPYSKTYDDSSYIQVIDNGTSVSYSICLVDEGGNAVANEVKSGESITGLTSIGETDIDDNKVILNSTIKVCQ